MSYSSLGRRVLCWRDQHGGSVLPCPPLIDSCRAGVSKPVVSQLVCEGRRRLGMSEAKVQPDGALVVEVVAAAKVAEVAPVHLDA